MSEMIRIDKSKYDKLCHEVRHLRTLSKVVDKVVDRVGSLDILLTEMKGTVINCEECPNKEVCYAYKHCPSIGTDTT